LRLLFFVLTFCFDLYFFYFYFFIIVAPAPLASISPREKHFPLAPNSPLPSHPIAAALLRKQNCGVDTKNTDPPSPNSDLPLQE
jgi:hypothetical protein